MKEALELLSCEEYLEKQRPRVVRYLKKKFGEEKEVREEDAIDAFYQGVEAMYNAIIEGRFEMQNEYAFAKYLQTTCRNQYCKMFGNQVITDSLDSEEWPPVLAVDEDDSPEQQEAYLELMESILMTLPYPCEDLIHGRYWHKFSAAEMAERLGYKNNRVAITTLNRCMKRLTDRFNEERKLIDEE